MMSRNDYYKKIGMAKNALIKQGKLTEGDYRGMLAMHGAVNDKGRFSASTLSGAELQSVLNRLKELGWQDNSRPSHLRLVNTPVQKKVWALWFELHQLGEVKNKKQPALDAWIAKETSGRVRSIRKLSNKKHHADAQKLIEQMKLWIKRVKAA